ncbi:MAG: hypothetical protein KGN02_00035 [bacterium]|nr:hypothetical protein [bacterium]
MRPTDAEPTEEELDELLTDEERRLLARGDLPDDVRAEIRDRLERRRIEELEEELPDGPIAD